MVARILGFCVALAAGNVQAADTQDVLSKLQLSGDFRLRYEANAASDDAPSRNRGVLRARLGARYDASDWLSIGARLATGDPDDPNSSDVTLSDFADDFSATLDQAYARLHRGSWDVYAGKIPNPFARTELIWDGDVNPEGVSGSWSVPFAHGATAKVTGMHFVVNEQATGADSAMTGLQLAASGAGWRRWSFDLAASYYDYRLVGLVGADAGDVRTNLLTVDGSQYLSDFDLADVVAGATHDTGNPAWPLRLVANYVKNLGAATSADTGYELDALWGRATSPRDIRVSYGYSVAETDAVLAAFSHDNTTLGTNYRQHALAVDHVLAPGTVLTATWYHYRLDDAGAASAEWLDRVRLNFMVQF
jgi:hypothetical protein